MIWRLGVAGRPIAHSRSPQLHLAGLHLAGLTGSSRRYEIGEADATRVRELMGSDVDALSITMPLKSAAAHLCDELDDRARSLDVVNSLVWRDGRLLGAATDGPGFVDSLRGEFDARVDNMHVVVVGAGAAARAIVDALVVDGVHSVSVLGRNEASVQRIVQRYDEALDHALRYRPVDLIVNTTPTTGRENAASVMSGVTRDTIAVDITYESAVSTWLAPYAHFGCRHTNGVAMLAYQAARQMNWWWRSDLDGAQLLTAVS